MDEHSRFHLSGFEFDKSLIIQLPVEAKSIQFGARYGNGNFYSDKKKKKFYDEIVDNSSFFFDEPLMGAISIWFQMFISPKNTSKHGQPKHAYQGPDVDNFGKGIQDALTKANPWKNDGQVFDFRATCFYRDEDELPYVRIIIAHYKPIQPLIFKFT